MDQLQELVTFLEAEQWDQTWDLFRQVHATTQPTAQLMLIGSHAAYGRKDLNEAKRLVEEADRLCPKHSDSLSGKIVFHRACVLRKYGETLQARDLFMQFLLEVECRYPELSFGIPLAYYYLGLIARSCRDYEGAVVLYQKAIALFKECGDLLRCCLAIQNMAWVLCVLRRPAEAGAALGEATRLFGGALPHVLVTEQALGNAYVALLEKRYGQSRKLLAQILDGNQHGVSNENLSMAWCLLGHVAAEEDRLDLARGMLQNALIFAEHAGEPRLMNDAMELRRLICWRESPPA